MPVRVLIVLPRLDIGGAEMHVARIVPELRRNGVDVSLFVLALGGNLERRVRDGGVPVSGVPFTPSRILRGVRAGQALRREITRLRPGIVHFFMPEAYVVGSLATLGMTSVHKIMSRRSLAHYQRNHPLLRLVEKNLHRSMAALIGNSSAVVAQLEEECGDRDKIGLIHNGIDLPSLPSREGRAATRRKLNIPANAFVIAVVANLIPYKGHADLLAGLGYCQSQLPKEWRLLLIGRDEGIGVALRKAADELGIAQKIIWLGEVPDAQAFLAAADIGALPSHQEGFSNSLLEKMSYALPVVATGVGGNLDAVVDGKTGFLVPIKSPQAFGDAIVKLADSEPLRARFGAAARQRVEQEFSLAGCVRRYMNLYERLIEVNRMPITEIIDSPNTLAPGVAAPG